VAALPEAVLPEAVVAAVGRLEEEEEEEVPDNLAAEAGRQEEVADVRQEVVDIRQEEEVADIHREEEVAAAIRQVEVVKRQFTLLREDQEVDKAEEEVIVEDIQEVA